MYYEIKDSIYEEYEITEEPSPLPSFKRGAMIQEKIDVPLEFLTNFTKDYPPKDFCKLSTPLISAEFLKILEKSGTQNLQLFPAVLKNPDTEEIWEDYFAANVIGLISCAELSKSDYDTIDPGDGKMPPLVHFRELVLDRKKILGNPILFRLGESPSILIAHQRVIDTIMENPKETGWGISVFPITCV